MKGSYEVAMSSFRIFVCSSVLIIAISQRAFHEVVVHDMIVLKEEKAMLRTETRGKFFRKGGEVVEFLINGKAIGDALSGGDGFAFKQFIPDRTGIYRFTAKLGKDEGQGVLLSLNRGTGIVIVDIEGSLLEEPLSKKPKSGSRKAISEISSRFPVVFVHGGFVSIKTIKAWLKENEFKELPVISWERGAAFDAIHEKGFRLKAIIGGPKVIESANKYRPPAFSFEETEDAVQVKDWGEIKKKLK
jgi:hypothetical protein